MPANIYKRIVDELSQRRFDGRLSYHFYSEPLLRDDLHELVLIAAARVKSAYQVLYTNGDLLTEERHRQLIAAGIHKIVVTRHDGDSFPERPYQIVLQPRDLTLTNRGGTLWATQQALTRRCVVPNELVVITVTGDVLLCYEDADRKNVFGNIVTESLIDIWNSAKAVDFRRALLAGKRSMSREMCAKCSNTAHSDDRSTWYAL